MACIENTLDSNDVGFSIAEEECLRQLPANPVWVSAEPNSYSDFGNEINKLMRTPINNLRQRQKGRSVGADATGGYNTDVTKTAINRLMQGFVFADAISLPSTRAENVAILSSYVTETTATTVVVESEQTWAEGAIVSMSGFANAANNGLKVVTGVAVSGSEVTLTVTPAPVAETVAVEDRHTVAVETVGFEFDAADIDVVVTSGIPALVSTVADFTAITELRVGTWVFLGGDSAANQLGANVGYARIKEIQANSLIFDETTFTPSDVTGTGVSLRMFVGNVIRNASNPEDIVQRSYQLERTLGYGDFAGLQAEYMIGAAPSEMTLTIPTEEFLNVDFSFMGCDIEYVTGEVGVDELKAGERILPGVATAYNSTSDIVRMRLSVLDPTTSEPTGLIGYVQEATVTITNNLTANKAVGVFGTLDFVAGLFEAGGSFTAYFTNVAALKAIRDDIDVEANFIVAYDNAGFIVDLPLVTLSGNSLSVEQDASVTLPIEMMGAQNDAGYTLQYEYFAYLPAIAMPNN